MIAPHRPRPDSGIDLNDPKLYNSRELSWLEFNQRVLDQAIDDYHPLLERVKFLAIVGSNLDEFYMVRVATHLKKMRAGQDVVSVDSLTISQQLAAIRTRSEAMMRRLPAGNRCCVRHSLNTAFGFSKPTSTRHRCTVSPLRTSSVRSTRS